MYDIYYDHRDGSDLHELFYGDWYSLQEHISDMYFDGCYNIEYHAAGEGVMI